MGFLVPAVTKHASLVVLGRVHNWRNLDLNSFPVATRGFITLFAPFIGATWNYRSLLKLSNFTEAMFNDTIRALKLVNSELSELRSVALQNRQTLAC